MSEIRTSMSEIVTRVFWETARDWSLTPEEGWSAFHDKRCRTSGQPNSPVLLDSSTGIATPPIRVRVLYLFGGDTVVFYVSYKGRTSPHHVNTLDFAQIESEDRSESVEGSIAVEKLGKYFSLTIFAPLLQPNKELPALSLLSLTSLTSIFAYLSAQELCHAGQACRALSAASSQDLLWQRLLERDFVQVGSLSGLPNSSATQAHAPPTPSASSTSPATPAAATTAETSSAKDRYRVCHAQRARQCLLQELEQQRRQQQWAAHQYPALPPPWLPAHWGEPPSWAPALPPLRLPYDTAGPHLPLPPGDGFNVPAFEGPYGLG